MSTQFDGGDKHPWYRQFWPWFLILLPASVVVAGLSTLYIANRHADDLVVDEYYKDGLAINRQLEKKQRAVDQGISAQLVFDTRSVTINLSGTIHHDELALQLSHPLEADRDFSVTLTRSGPGLYTGALEQAVAPRWHWTLQAPQDSGWRLDGALRETDFERAADN